MSTVAQERPQDPQELARSRFVGNGYKAEDNADLVVKDRYRDPHSGVEHNTLLNRRWHGIEVFNGDIAVHQAVDGRVIAMNNGAWAYCGTTRTLSSDPVLVDLGLSTTATYGTDVRRSRDGKMLPWSGKLQYIGSGKDRDPILQGIGGAAPTAASAGYGPADVNMDGSVKYTGSNDDRDAVLQNTGGAAPTAVSLEQLP